MITSYPQIAGRLNISVITVKAHRGNVMRKMSVESLADLVKAAAALDADRLRSGSITAEFGPVVRPSL